MSRSIAIGLAVLLFATIAAAETRFDAGFTAGQQQYPGDDHNKVVTEVEVLGLRNNVGMQAALQYADLSVVDGPLLATHVDLVYRLPLGSDFYAMAGAGPSFIRVGSTVTETTWNAFGEIGHAWRRADLFARVRQFDFNISETRAGEAGPTGPAISIGARFLFKR